MSRATAQFVCAECGGESLRWSGQCPRCQAWNSLQEQVAVATKRSRHAANGAARATLISDVPEDRTARRRLAWDELNRVLGGGIVAGSIVLIGGEPGVGKSTLLMHVATQVAAGGGSVLYASGEESAQQVRMRASRLGALGGSLLVLAENDLAAIVAEIERIRPALAIVDSIQTVSDGAIDSAAGSVSQVRECAAHLTRVAKASGVPVFLVGHVTKDGALAGPRLLEHIVDTVLYLEGDRQHDFRILRATKNRFGSADELGIFSMGEAGLVEVGDPSATLVGERSQPAVGTAVVPALEGTRPLLVEIQSLASATQYPPRRVVNGLDLNRVHMVLAVLSNRAGIGYGDRDVFVSVAGGVRVVEPAADLAIALSLAGNSRGRPLDDRTVVIGELGLTGEVRPVRQMERRMSEAARRGFTRAIVPAGHSGGEPPGLNLAPVRTLSEAVRAAFGQAAAAET